jgi:hypothetical protein
MSFLHLLRPPSCRLRWLKIGGRHESTVANIGSCDSTCIDAAAAAAAERLITSDKVTASWGDCSGV